MPTKECDTCNNVKDVGEFNKTSDGASYNNCKDCFLDVWRKDQLEFWVDKNTRRCGICTEVVPLASTQGMLTEFLIGIVGAAIVKRQRESLPKEKMLKQRLE